MSKRALHDYGQIHVRRDGRKQVRELVHRVVFENCVGVIPHGLDVLHRCDTPSCVRPDHLFLGTNLDNVADRVSKGRHVALAPRGEGHGNAVLSDHLVREIRGRYAHGGVTQTELARAFGVTQSVVSLIVRGEAWTHVGGPLRRCFDRR